MHLLTNEKKVYFNAEFPVSPFDSHTSYFIYDIFMTTQISKLII